MVQSLVVQPDGKILVSGLFGTLGGQARNFLGRLNIDGTLDTMFNPSPIGEVTAMSVQADGKILIGGVFTSVGSELHDHIARLNSDGSPDTIFDLGADNAVLSLALLMDGRILVGGNFATLGGQPRDHIGQLKAIEPATRIVSYDDSTITWLRGGTTPEVWRTTFEHSPDGFDWTFLGIGERVPGGWQLTNVSLPPLGTGGELLWDAGLRHTTGRPYKHCWHVRKHPRSSWRRRRVGIPMAEGWDGLNEHREHLRRQR
jgi:uncharacterized delta-60 repeat protein